MTSEQIEQYKNLAWGAQDCEHIHSTVPVGDLADVVLALIAALEEARHSALSCPSTVPGVCGFEGCPLHGEIARLTRERDEWAERHKLQREEIAILREPQAEIARLRVELRGAVWMWAEAHAERPQSAHDHDDAVRAQVFEAAAAAICHYCAGVPYAESVPERSGVGDWCHRYADGSTKKDMQCAAGAIHEKARKP